eukprot:scaffold41051_cov62-Phaeocystis_antarctica.AAC.1
MPQRRLQVLGARARRAEQRAPVSRHAHLQHEQPCRRLSSPPPEHACHGELVRAGRDGACHLELAPVAVDHREEQPRRQQHVRSVVGVCQPTELGLAYGELAVCVGHVGVSGVGDARQRAALVLGVGLGGPHVELLRRELLHQLVLDARDLQRLNRQRQWNRRLWQC